MDKMGGTVLPTNQKLPQMQKYVQVLMPMRSPLYFPYNAPVPKVVDKVLNPCPTETMDVTKFL